MPGLNYRDGSVPPSTGRFRTRDPERTDRQSDTLCPVCLYRLHVLLTQAGETVHPLCGPPPRHLRSVS